MNDLLRVLCIISAVYAIGFGLMAIPTGLFVGPHVLLAGVAQIAFGILFVLSALALSNSRRWGVWLAISCSLVAGGVALFGLVDTASRPDSLEWLFFALFAGYFWLMAGVAAFLAMRPKIGS